MTLKQTSFYFAGIAESWPDLYAYSVQKWPDEHIVTISVSIFCVGGLVFSRRFIRLLNEPRPIVVGIAWVVECVEQRTLLKEERFKIDLDVVDTNKVRCDGLRPMSVDLV
jgi:hypothetical protein